MGAGDVERLARRLVSRMSGAQPPSAVQRDQPLARLTTVRTGGRGEYFARAGEDGAPARRCSPGREGSRCASRWSAPGSNLLIADEGVRGLVLKLDGELAGSRSRAARVAVRGRRAACRRSRRARRGPGSRGSSSASNIPGTIGGAVRMNANAYGGELGRVLEWVELARRRRA